MLRLVLAGSVAVLTVLMAVACGGGDSPTSTVAQDGSGGSEVTAVPTSTAAQDGSGGSLATAAPTSTVARDGSGSSEVTVAAVAEYAVWCGERDSQEFDITTWGQSEKYFAEEIDAFEDKSAPEELKAFHDAAIALLKAMHDFARMQDASELIDNAAAPNDEIRTRMEALLGVADTLDDETLSQLTDVDCIYS